MLTSLTSAEALMELVSWLSPTRQTWRLWPASEHALRLESVALRQSSAAVSGPWQAAWRSLGLLGRLLYLPKAALSLVFALMTHGVGVEAQAGPAVADFPRSLRYTNLPQRYISTVRTVRHAASE